MVFAYVRENNPRALSPVNTHNHTISALLHQHAYALCEIFDVEHWNITQRTLSAIMSFKVELFPLMLSNTC